MWVLSTNTFISKVGQPTLGPVPDLFPGGCLRRPTGTRIADEDMRGPCMALPARARRRASQASHFKARCRKQSFYTCSVIKLTSSSGIKRTECLRRPQGDKRPPKSLSCWACLVAQTVKNLPAVRETWVRSLGWEDALEKGRVTHSSILAWKIPWRGRYRPWGRKELDTTEQLTGTDIKGCLSRRGPSQRKTPEREDEPWGRGQTGSQERGG